MSKSTLPQGTSETTATMPSSIGRDFSALEGIFIEFSNESLSTYASEDVHDFHAFFTDDTHQVVVTNVLDVLISQTVEILKVYCNLTSSPENILPLVNQCPFNFRSKDHRLHRLRDQNSIIQIFNLAIAEGTKILKICLLTKSLHFHSYFNGCNLDLVSMTPFSTPSTSTNKTPDSTNSSLPLSQSAAIT
jgi:hypothetical protein